jgi:pyruvate dehydrogenase E1 component alpha subunit
MIDAWSLYALMYRSRKFEQAVRQVWKDGLISGEMHLGIGEEAIIAAVVSQLGEGDAMALDHRGTAALLMRGVDALSLLREFMGKRDGLCHGQGGHMHLFAPELLAASSGIVGASGPAGAGFALAAQVLRPGTVSVAFFGEGATSAGMLMESMNLAVVWRLPQVFICKDNGWAITTTDAEGIGGNLLQRAQGFGMKAQEMDGTDAAAAAAVAKEALEHARSGGGPVFIWAHCARPEGHFLGDALLESLRHPWAFIRKRGPLMLKGLLGRSGSRLSERIASLRNLVGRARAIQSQADAGMDPLRRARSALAGEDMARLAALEAAIRDEIDAVVTAALLRDKAEGSPA